MATSGTISTTTFNVGKIIDSAYRRCKIAPQQISAEQIEFAKDELYLLLSRLANKGMPLWSISKRILPIYESIQDVPCPLGTIDILNANLRTSTRLTGSPNSTEGIASYAFDADLTTACVQTTPAGSITSYLNGGYYNPPVWGILPNSTGFWDFVFQTSLDGVTWKTVYTGSQIAMIAGQWFWVDLEGIGASSVGWIRLQALNTTVLNVTEFVVEDAPNEIPIAKLSRDDYANLPSKFFLGRPVQYWYDKQLTPVMTLWPAPQVQYTFNQIILYVQRYIEDIGELTDDLEVPQNARAGIISELARKIALSDPQVKPEVLPVVVQEATEDMNDMWAGQTDGASVNIRVRISAYTK